MKAGWCAQCAANVYLDDEGRCVNGHPADDISGIYDVPDIDIPTLGHASAAAEDSATTSSAPTVPLNGAPADPAPVPLNPGGEPRRGMSTVAKVFIGLAVLALAIGGITLAALIGLVGGAADSLESVPDIQESAPPLESELPEAEPADVPTATADTGLMPEADYALAIADNTQALGESLTSLGKLLLDPEVDDAGWVKKVTSECATLKVLSKKAKTIKSPPKFAKAHDEFLAAMSDFEWVGTNLPRAIEGSNDDQAALNQCAKRMQSGQKHLLDWAKLYQEAAGQ